MTRSAWVLSCSGGLKARPNRASQLLVGYVPELQEGAMRVIRRACTAVLVSMAMIGTSGCGPSVHVHFNNGQTKVHVGGSRDRTAGAHRDSAGRGTGRHR